MVVNTLLEHGLPTQTEVVLLNWRMCEDRAGEALRKITGLTTAKDWQEKANKHFSSRGQYCPRCGLKTLTIQPCPLYCYECGCKLTLVRKGG